MESLIAMIMGFLLFFVLFFLAWIVLTVVGTWKTLTKAGEEGWAALIPFYSDYMLCKISGVNPWWILINFLSPILSVVPIVGSLASLAAQIYYRILLGVSLSRSFDKGDGFAVGLVIVPPIFLMMLGFGDAKYAGAKPMNDPVFGNKTGNTPSSDSSSKFCTSCGAKLDGNSNFCPYCGKESK